MAIRARRSRRSEASRHRCRGASCTVFPVPSPNLKWPSPGLVVFSSDNHRRCITLTSLVHLCCVSFSHVYIGVLCFGLKRITTWSSIAHVYEGRPRTAARCGLMRGPDPPAGGGDIDVGPAEYVVWLGGGLIPPGADAAMLGGAPAIGGIPGIGAPAKLLGRGKDGADPA